PHQRVINRPDRLGRTGRLKSTPLISAPMVAPRRITSIGPGVVAGFSLVASSMGVLLPGAAAAAPPESSRLAPAGKAPAAATSGAAASGPDLRNLLGLAPWR